MVAPHRPLGQDDDIFWANFYRLVPSAVLENFAVETIFFRDADLGETFFSALCRKKLNLAWIPTVEQETVSRPAFFRSGKKDLERWLCLERAIHKIAVMRNDNQFLKLYKLFTRSNFRNRPSVPAGTFLVTPPAELRSTDGRRRPSP